SIQTVDRMEKESRRARRHLAQVSKEFQRYGEREIRRAYEMAERIQVELGIARERERSQSKKRDELERSLVNVQRLVEKAEKTVSHVTVAMEILLGNLEALADHWKGIQEIGRAHV